MTRFPFPFIRREVGFVILQMGIEELGAVHYVRVRKLTPSPCTRVSESKINRTMEFSHT